MLRTPSALRTIAHRRSSSSSLAVVHRIGEDYTSREYLLLPAHTTERKYALASLRSHRNIIFGARLHAAENRSLVDVCGPLVERALDDCSAEGEQVQAVGALHGLSGWVVQNWDTFDLDDDITSKEAAYAIATGIPRTGHSVVGQGTFRDGAKAWKRLAAAYVPHNDEAQLYMNHGAQLLHIEHMADTSSPYLKSAGGAMARFLFL